MSSIMEEYGSVSTVEEEDSREEEDDDEDSEEDEVPFCGCCRITFDDLNHARIKKRGHIFCGCCCDVRRATIVINIISIICLLLNLVIVVCVSISERSTTTGDDEVDMMMIGDDDEHDDTLEAVVDSMPLAVWVITFLLGVFWRALAIDGAMTFTLWKVSAGLFVYGTAALTSLLLLDPINLVINCFFAYPHYHLYLEIRTRLMSRHNYRNEEYCCCL